MCDLHECLWSQPEAGRSGGDSRVGESSAPVFPVLPQAQLPRSHESPLPAIGPERFPTASPSGISVVIVRLADAEPRLRASPNIDRRDAPAQAVIMTVPQVVEREEGTVRIWREPDLRADFPEAGCGELLSSSAMNDGVRRISEGQCPNRKKNDSSVAWNRTQFLDSPRSAYRRSLLRFS